jgi:uncharacterized protein (TIGR03437 family)
MAITLSAQTFTTLHSFGGADGVILGVTPQGLVQGLDGNLYGTTYLSEGGSTVFSGGTVFKITPSGTLTTLFDFSCSSVNNCADGAVPNGGLVQGTDGNFYGTTSWGGGSDCTLFGGATLGCGTVFRISPGGTLTTLYRFCSQDYPACTDGEAPTAGLIQGANGSFYGAASYGGYPNYWGTIFSITSSGALTTLYAFPCTNLVDCPQGDAPQYALVQGADGNFYGVTQYGGNYERGAAFKITPGGALTTLYSFDYPYPAGAQPGMGLIRGADGNLYGATVSYGANGTNDGAIFRMTPSGSVTALYSFCAQVGCTDGTAASSLIQASDGNFYGTTGDGGANGHGTIFKITPSGTLTTLYSFCSESGCADGAAPEALIQATDGNFYGTASGFGLTQGPVNGTVFKLSTGLGPFVTAQLTSGSAGATVQILGSNLTGTTSVTFNGITAAFTVVSPSLISATVPAGATTGPIQVTSPGGTLLSNPNFVVPPPFTVALSTAGQVEPFAAESIVSAYGTTLADGTAAASNVPLPTSLAGTTVTVTDSAGIGRAAPLFYVSPSQINFEIPAGTATGTASVSIQEQSGAPQTASVEIGNVSPGVFELNAMGLGAAWALPVVGGTQQELQPVYQIASSGAVVPLPISLGASTEEIYLEVYGTGIRNANSVATTVGGVNVPVLYAGPAPGFSGEDQVNIGPLPGSLAGAGSVNIMLMADGQVSNTVNVTIQ